MTRIPLGRAHGIASAMTEDLWQTGVDIISITPVGSLRRFAPDVGDVSLLAVTEHQLGHVLLDAAARLPRVKRVGARKAASVTVNTEHSEVTIHVADRAAAGAALACLTGSARHITALATLAESFRLRLGPGQLTDALGAPVRCETEEDLYEQLGLAFVPPELRHGEDEIAAALDGRLPHLLSDLHIRGDLHMHTTWSDGRDTMDAMVRASRGLGYEYIAITDHSARAMASRTLAADQIAAQRAELEHLRRTHPGMHILHGIELEILKDGTLDFDDSVLAEFDIVLASLHDHADQPGDVLTDRYLRAMRNPYVNVITHPANRSPAESHGYDLNYDRLFEAARETHTALEVDGSPAHLDMDGALARRAVAAGVTLVVDSDCHRADALSRQMRFGIATARRGWIEPDHVLNTRSLDEIRAFVARKRARG